MNEEQNLDRHYSHSHTQYSQSHEFEIVKHLGLSSIIKQTRLKRNSDRGEDFGVTVLVPGLDGAVAPLDAGVRLAASRDTHRRHRLRR